MVASITLELHLKDKSTQHSFKFANNCINSVLLHITVVLAYTSLSASHHHKAIGIIIGRTVGIGYSNGSITNFEIVSKNRLHIETISVVP